MPSVMMITINKIKAGEGVCRAHKGKVRRYTRYQEEKGNHLIGKAVSDSSGELVTVHIPSWSQALVEIPYEEPEPPSLQTGMPFPWLRNSEAQRHWMAEGELYRIEHTSAGDLFSQILSVIA